MRTIPIAPTKNVLGKVQLRGGFSDRNNINNISTQIQLTDFDERTRTIIRNKIQIAFGQISASVTSSFGATWRDMYLSVMEEVYCLDITQLIYGDEPSLCQIFNQYIESTIKNDTYDSILTLIEYIFNWTSKHFSHRQHLVNYEHYIADTPTSGHYQQYRFNEKEFINEVFEKECVGYRFVVDKITKITDFEEIQEIEEAACCEFDGCRSHISRAVGFLADRESKDYKNCVKESISAVESICKVITQNEHATLGDALKELEKKRGLKGPLKTAFEKLYSYTNDKGGVRHADGLFVSEVSFEEAKFMLVSCSAFVNYLIAEYGKISGDKQ